MKIIEALKKTKDLKRQIDDIKSKVKTYCADWDCDEPVYPDQKGKISEWLQSHHDLCKEILRRKIVLQKTNLQTQVTITINKNDVTKSISEWIIRRRELSSEEYALWEVLTDGGYNPNQDFKQKMTPTSPDKVVKRRLYFDPSQRDRKREEYRSEPHLIDSTLEVVNAVTSIIE